MASKQSQIEPENGTELCRVRDEGGVKGFRKECLKEKLTERDCTFLTCSRCQGILREACNSKSGKQLCLCCKKKEENTYPNLQVRNTVLSLKSLCPIHKRGCNWVGNLGDCEKHLKTCGYVYEKCKLGCGVVLSRDELKIHSKEACSQRIVVCEYCKEKFKHRDLLTHHTRCNKMPVPCELRCDKLVIRENMRQHMVIECGEKEVNCPFVQYGCKVGLIKRKEMNQHLEDKKTEHMEIKMNSLEETVVKQNEIITQLSEKMDTLFNPEEHNVALLNMEITHLCKFTSKEYMLCGLPMSFIFRQLATVSKKLTIYFHITNQRSMFQLNHRYGYFITRLVCHNDDRRSLEFKSRGYKIGRPDSLADKMSMYTEGEIASIDLRRNEEMFIRNGSIVLEITFVKL